MSFNNHGRFIYTLFALILLIVISYATAQPLQGHPWTEIILPPGNNIWTNLNADKLDGLDFSNFSGRLWSGYDPATSNIWYNDGGNVGIGTSNPSYKLDVSGSIRASGDVTGSRLCLGTSCINSWSGKGRLAKRIFVTSQIYDGNLGGREGADQKCQEAADNAGLDGTWKALIATTDKNLPEVLGYDWLYLVNTRGELVAINKPVSTYKCRTTYHYANAVEIAWSESECWPSIISSGNWGWPVIGGAHTSPWVSLYKDSMNNMIYLYNIIYDEFKNQQGSNSNAVFVWTGAGSHYDDTCGNWGYNYPSYNIGGTIGIMPSLSSSWFYGSIQRCDQKLHLYCIEV